jgi:nitrogen regulatory protein PII-like uncharacterized protein
LTDSEIPNLIVIDKRIVWYGGINPFSYQNIEETILKIEDPVTANEILQDFENKAVTQSTLFDT